MFKIENSNNEVKVHVSLKERKYARDPHASVDTGKVLDFLKTQGYDISKIDIKDNSFCSTTGNNPTLKGTWVFSKKKEEKNAKSVKSSPRRRSNNDQKDKLLGNENVDGVQPQTQTSIPRQNKKVSGQ